MLFKRRVAPDIAERLRVWLWPRRSWSRSLRYVLLRIIRLRANPHSLALGCAAGVFAACTPLIGGQIVMAVLLAYTLRANIPAAILATFFGNPLSWPVIWAATYVAGIHMIGGDAGAASVGELHARVDVLWQAMLGQSPELIAAAAAFVGPVVMPMLAGSLPIGLAAGLLIYYIMRAATRAVQQRRMSRACAPVVAGALFDAPELAETHA
ncbi:MAG: DUF2062 domain-containing protein [Hyphomicrobiaceae bacterium]|nr:DUF2062 domain-containing protein [Hyphomicrobiaceae bacterium]MCC0008180.1 DUF2062 domain-containing protein [Hyphomicrobiaceae bacterium]